MNSADLADKDAIENATSVDHIFLTGIWGLPRYEFYMLWVLNTWICIDLNEFEWILMNSNEFQRI